MADGESDRKRARNGVKQKAGRGVPVKGRHPGSETAAETHGGQNPVHPLHADSVIGMKEVQAEKKTRTLVAVEEFHR